MERLSLPRPSRVALVDAHLNPRLFVQDDAFHGLLAPLRGLGIETILLEWVKEDPPLGKSIEEVSRALEELRPELVVVSRAWNVEVIEGLRKAAPGAKVVRYSRGVSGAIDERFDGVVGGEGLLALAAGEEVSAPSWRRSREELKGLKVVPGASFGTRPTISGPARGRPFLADVRSSPAWRGRSIDLEKVQRKGCSFCLDNVGAYAAFREEEVVGAWVGQLRMIRAVQPESREVLLTDEYPHRHLPALFRAIKGDPGLHGVELLFKSRVDWLAEHADGALAEACELAKQSGSVLHLYLVGFESFHQPDLDLFNKATTVEENRRAIEILRALEARFPESFEFRRHRAHGILLFHPWTTPEGLLDNARHLKESAFHELRSRALQTRLRLYPSVPLYELARAQGLLADAFPEARGDRSEEQGYDASVPWRFADPRVEAIFQAADRLSRLLPELPEPDLLEMVVRFVLRWPAFAEAPGLTALPILQALFTWGALPAEVLRVVGPTAAGFDREVEQVASGAKEACLKEGVPQGDAAPLVEAYRRMGLTAAICSVHALGGDDGRHQAGDSHAIVAIARDEATLALALERQRRVEAGDSGQIAPMGGMMGYPPCCTAAFLEARDRGDNLDLERLPFRRTPDRPLEPRLNRLGAVTLLSHLLCSPDCAGSITLAQGLLDTLARLDKDAPRRILEHLAAPVLRLDYRRAALLAGAWEGDRFRVDALRPFAGAPLGVDGDRVRSLRLRPEGVVFDLDGEGPRELPSPAPFLIEPGAPLASAVRSLLDAPRRGRQAKEGQESPHRGGPVSLEQIAAALRGGLPEHVLQLRLHHVHARPLAPARAPGVHLGRAAGHAAHAPGPDAARRRAAGQPPGDAVPPGLGSPEDPGRRRLPRDQRQPADPGGPHAPGAVPLRQRHCQPQRRQRGGLPAGPAGDRPRGRAAEPGRAPGAPAPAGRGLPRRAQLRGAAGQPRYAPGIRRAGPGQGPPYPPVAAEPPRPRRSRFLRG
jgi:hypothetical protein